MTTNRLLLILAVVCLVLATVSAFAATSLNTIGIALLGLSLWAASQLA